MLKDLLSDFKSNPIGVIAKWQDARFLWLLMSFCSLFLVITAHSLFQRYLYMAPCEQCVYIRFAFFCMFFAGLIASVNPKNIVFKSIGYVLAFYGAIKGIGYSVKLNAIHKAVRSDDPFGVQGCSAEPAFPFGLPLDGWFADWFKPTGDCGYDNPIIPPNVQLDFIQQWLTELYSQGWYLIPKYHFINMAEACWFAFVVCTLLLSLMLISYIVKIRSKR